MRLRRLRPDRAEFPMRRRGRRRRTGGKRRSGGLFVEIQALDVEIGQVAELGDAGKARLRVRSEIGFCGRISAGGIGRGGGGGIGALPESHCEENMVLVLPSSRRRR